MVAALGSSRDKRPKHAAPSKGVPRSAGRFGSSSASVGKHARGAISSSGNSRVSVSGHVRVGGAQNTQRAPLVQPKFRGAQGGEQGDSRQRPSNRFRILKRVSLGILTAVLIVFFALGAYALWYSSALNDALSMGSELDAQVNTALVSEGAGEPFYMLLLGSDSREGSGTSDKAAESGDKQRSDVMILTRVDAAKKQVTMVSIPRDSPLTLPDGSIVKINEAYNIGGAAYSIKAVSDLTGVSISHYAEIHFSELQQMVNKLGGVTVDVPVELSYKDALTGETVTIEPGTQTLDGQQAQIFARARHEYGSDQDVKRQDNVRILAMALITEALDRPLYELPGTALDLATCVGTDMNTADIVSLALNVAGASGKMKIYSCTGPNAGAINNEAGGAWLCYENPEGWKSLMAVVDAGEDPKGIDVNTTAIIPTDKAA